MIREVRQLDHKSEFNGPTIEVPTPPDLTYQTVVDGLFDQSKKLTEIKNWTGLGSALCKLWPKVKRISDPFPVRAAFEYFGVIT